MTDTDDLEERVDLILKNIELREAKGQLEEQVQQLQQKVGELEKIAGKVTGPAILPNLLQKYEQFVRDATARYFYAHPSLDLYKNITTPIEEVLTPTEIDDFLQMTHHHSIRKSYQRTMGIFISKLVQNSYDKGGHRNFTLTLGYHKVDYLGAYLFARREEPIDIAITGSMGLFPGYGSNNAKIYRAADIKTDTDVKSISPAEDSSNILGPTILLGMVGLAGYLIYQLIK